MESVTEAGLALQYTAKSLHLVAGGTGLVEVLLDGRPLSQEEKGEDIRLEGEASILAISSHRLYRIVASPDYGTHAIAFRVAGPVKIYSFTFG